MSNYMITNSFQSSSCLKNSPPKEQKSSTINDDSDISKFPNQKRRSYNKKNILRLVLNYHTPIIEEPESNRNCEPLPVNQPENFYKLNAGTVDYLIKTSKILLNKKSKFSLSYQNLVHPNFDFLESDSKYSAYDDRYQGKNTDWEKDHITTIRTELSKTVELDFNESRFLSEQRDMMNGLKRKSFLCFNKIKTLQSSLELASSFKMPLENDFGIHTEGPILSKNSQSFLKMKTEISACAIEESGLESRKNTFSIGKSNQKKQKIGLYFFKVQLKPGLYILKDSKDCFVSLIHLYDISDMIKKDFLLAKEPDFKEISVLQSNILKVLELSNGDLKLLTNVEQYSKFLMEDLTSFSKVTINS